MIREGHEHGVAAHQVDPLESFRFAGPGIAEVLDDRLFIVHRDDLAIACLERHTTQSQIDELEFGIGGNCFSSGKIDQNRFFKIAGQETAVGAAGQYDDLAHGDLPFDAASAGFIGNIVIEVNITAGLA